MVHIVACRRLVMAAACICGLVAQAALRPAHAETLDLATVVARAMRDNPDLREARSRALAAHGDRRMAGAPPAPGVAYNPGNPAQYALSVPVDVGPQRWLRTNAAAHGLRAARLDVADAERLVRFSARQAFFDALLADSLAALAADQYRMLAAIAAADSLRLRAGDIAERAATRSAIEAAQAHAAAARAHVDALAAHRTLAQVLGMPGDGGALALAGDLRFEPLARPGDSLALHTAAAARPDLAAAAERERAARANTRAALANLLPVPQLTWVRQPDAAFPSGRHDAFGVALTLPWFDLQGGPREKARADAQVAQVEVARAQAAAAAGLATALERFAAAREAAERYAGGLLARSAAAVQAARFAYERGAIAPVDLFDVIRADAEVRTDALTALHDYWVDAYAIDREAGKELLP